MTSEQALRFIGRSKHECVMQLIRAGFAVDDAQALRRIAMTLHRWHCLERGTSNGAIERDEKTGIPYWYNANSRYLAPNDPRSWSRVPDREAGAKKRLASIIARYPDFDAYIQGDPRGASLYILCKATTPQPYDQFYNRGIAVYR